MNAILPDQHIRHHAFLDLGTNAARLAVYAIAADAPPSLLTERRIVTRLGSSINGNMPDEAGIRRALEAARRLSLIAKEYRASLTAIATAAVRDSAGRTEFCERFRAITGVPLQIISGYREARLIYHALANSIPADPPTLLLDIGGGSTEIIVGSSKKIHEIISWPIGAVRLSEQFPRSMRAEPTPAAVYCQMQYYVQRHAGARVASLRRYNAVSAVAVAGTSYSLAALITARTAAPDASEPVIACSLINHLAEQIRRLSRAERRALPGMSSGRADIILAGLAILSTILQTLRLQRLHLSNAGLRDGLLREFLSRQFRSQGQLIHAHNRQDHSQSCK
ncbi:MAG: Ppx/GppA phosphatase family protein [Kiritimatiellia bacterium]|jgi:exopolyphosphatase/guanosine-5'-triphosphate,3'-diphosphate pyrophosphatase